MWKEFWANYWRRIIGVAAGLTFGLIYLIAGFWDMLFVCLLVGIGYWYGKQKELTSGSVFHWERIWHSIMKLFRPYR